MNGSGVKIFNLLYIPYIIYCYSNGNSVLRIPLLIRRGHFVGSSANEKPIQTVRGKPK